MHRSDDCLQLELTPACLLERPTALRAQSIHPLGLTLQLLFQEAVIVGQSVQMLTPLTIAPAQKLIARSTAPGWCPKEQSGYMPTVSVICSITRSSLLRRRQNRACESAQSDMGRWCGSGWPTTESALPSDI